MSAQILFSDNFHINKKNFASIYAVLSKKEFQISTLEQGKDLWNKCGNYFDQQCIEQKTEIFKNMSPQQLRAMTGKVCGLTINAYDIARSEILAYALAQFPSWYNFPLPNDDNFIFQKLISENPLLLHLNLACVLYWCEIYSQEIKNINKYTAVIVFSGSQIYQHLLLKLCQASVPRAFVIESFLTGTEFYFEERYEPITRGSDIRFDSVYRSLSLPQDTYLLQKEINKATNKLLNAKNKNVRQPKDAIIPSFSSHAPVVLLAAQVQNDFSILESNLKDLNALSNYKVLLKELLNNTDFNIIIKTHPWEKNKTHLNDSFTFNNLQSFIAKLPAQYLKRIHICEHVNLIKLIKHADIFLTLGSQSVFEACFYGGLKPFIVSSTFYNERGFTNYFDNLAEAVIAISNNKNSWVLSLKEYDYFLNFLTRLLQLHLPSVYKSGEAIISSRLSGKAYVEVKKSVSPPIKTNENLELISNEKTSPPLPHTTVLIKDHQQSNKLIQKKLNQENPVHKLYSQAVYLIAKHISKSNRPFNIFRK